MSVLVRYHNGACLTTRELVDADRCPKCLSLGWSPLCRRVDHEGEFAPVRCMLCDTEYARIVKHTERRTSDDYWGTGDRLQVRADAGVRGWLRIERELDPNRMPDGRWIGPVTNHQALVPRFAAEGGEGARMTGTLGAPSGISKLWREDGRWHAEGVDADGQRWVTQAGDPECPPGYAYPAEDAAKFKLEPVEEESDDGST